MMPPKLCKPCKTMHRTVLHGLEKPCTRNHAPIEKEYLHGFWFPPKNPLPVAGGAREAAGY
jgi:hypothetical protein